MLPSVGGARRYGDNRGRRGAGHIVSPRAQLVENVNGFVPEYAARWHSGRAMDLRSTGRGFDSRPLRFQVQPWASCSHTHVPLSPSSINLILAQVGKVTVSLASHWSCVTNNSGVSTYGLTALERKMSTPPTFQPEWGYLYLLPCIKLAFVPSLRCRNSVEW